MDEFLFILGQVYTMQSSSWAAGNFWVTAACSCLHRAGIADWLMYTWPNMTVPLKHFNRRLCWRAACLFSHRQTDFGSTALAPVFIYLSRVALTWEWGGQHHGGFLHGVVRCCLYFYFLILGWSQTCLLIGYAKLSWLIFSWNCQQKGKRVQADFLKVLTTEPRRAKSTFPTHANEHLPCWNGASSLLLRGRENLCC